MRRLPLVTVGMCLGLGSALGQQTNSAPSEASNGQTSPDLSLWIQGFRLSPQPDQIPWALKELNLKWDWSESGELPAAFLAEVFRQYPNRVPEWISGIGEFSLQTRRFILQSLWWSGIEGATELLTSVAEGAEADLAATLRRWASTDPPVLVDMEIKPEVLDRLWASYFASGNVVYLERLVSALAIPAPETPKSADDLVQGAARWSLSSNAEQYDDIRDALQELQATSEGVIHEELATILRELPPKTPPLDESAPAFPEFDLRQLLRSKQAGDEEAEYTFDLEFADRLLAGLQVHANQWPARFRSKEDHVRAVRFVQRFGKVIDPLLAQDSPAPLLLRAARLHSMGHNLEIPGSAQKSIELFEKLVEIDSESPSANYYYGVFLAGTGSLTERSIAYLEKARSLGVTEATYTLAIAHLTARGDQDTATKILEDYVKEQPEDEQAAILLNALKTGQVNIVREGGE